MAKASPNASAKAIVRMKILAFFRRSQSCWRGNKKRPTKMYSVCIKFKSLGDEDISVVARDVKEAGVHFLYAAASRPTMSSPFMTNGGKFSEHGRGAAGIKFPSGISLDRAAV